MNEPSVFRFISTVSFYSLRWHGYTNPEKGIFTKKEILHELVQFQAWNTVIKIWNLIWMKAPQPELKPHIPNVRVSSRSSRTLNKTWNPQADVHVEVQDFFQVHDCSRSTVDRRRKLVFFMIWMTSSMSGGTFAAVMQQEGNMGGTAPDTGLEPLEQKYSRPGTLKRVI